MDSSNYSGGGYVFAPTGERVFSMDNWSPGAVYLSLNLDGGTVQVLSAQEEM